MSAGEPAYPCTVSVEVAARPEQVFAVLSDPRRLGEWSSTHLDWPDGTPGPLVAGLRFVQRVTLMGMPAEVRWTVAAAEAGRALRLDGAGPMGIAVRYAFTLTPAPGGTTIRFDGGVGGGTADGPLGPMVARNIADAMRESLTRLAALTGDAGPTAAPPATAAPPLTEAPPQRRSAAQRTRPAPIRHERSGREIDPWTPVIVGAGQICERSTEPVDGDPVALAVRALRRAAEDSGAGAGLLARADLVGYVASVSWQYPDGAALIARAVGAAPVETVRTATFGGDGSLRLLNDAAGQIAAGRAAIAVLGGAEAAATAAAAERAGHPLDWARPDAGRASHRVIGADTEANTGIEIAAGLVAPIHLYALIESAVRARRGAAAAEHEQHITELWARFSEVAAANPYAWLPRRHTAAQLAAPDGGNRPIAAPYRKLLTANLQVNQATGLIVCSAEAARDAGIAQDRWVFLHAGAYGTDQWFVTERAELAASPAIRAIGARLLEHSGLVIDDVRHVDLYACFPSAVQIAAWELGLPTDDPRRPLTVTGGLTFAGGPGNNYTSHAVANLVGRLRTDPDGYGLATAIGWYLTKHAGTVLSARPPLRGFRDLDVDDGRPKQIRQVRADHTGPAVLEAYTVPYDRDGEPEAVILTALTADGARLVRRLTDRALIDRMLAGDPLGRTLQLTTDGVNQEVRS